MYLKDLDRIPSFVSFEKHFLVAFHCLRWCDTFNPNVCDGWVLLQLRKWTSNEGKYVKLQLCLSMPVTQMPTTIASRCTRIIFNEEWTFPWLQMDTLSEGGRKLFTLQKRRHWKSPLVIQTIETSVTISARYIHNSTGNMSTPWK